MKAISKLFALAVASVALASCSDDLGISKATFSADKAGATAVLEQPGSGDAFTRMGMVDQVGVVWTDADILRVFTLDNLVYNRYTLVDGEGQTSGDFVSSDTHELSGTKYAITEAKMVYGVSAYAETHARLTMTLTPGYKVDEEMLAEGVHNFPIPMWGLTNETDNGDGTWKINTSLKSLISYLRVDLKNIPADTKAIVLTTHGAGDESAGGYVTGRDPQGFFQLITPKQLEDLEAAYGFDASDYNWWYKLYQKEVKDNDGTWGGVYGGKSEPLAGTLNCLLEDNENLYPLQSKSNFVGYHPYLKVDPASRLVTSDTLRVDIAEIKAMFDDYGNLEYQNADQIIYLPVLVNTYDELHVIAVTGDSPLSYQWIGKEIAYYQDETFARNDVHYIDLQNVMLEGVQTPQSLSYAIQENIDYDNLYRTSVIYVEEFDNTIDADGKPGIDPIIIDRETIGNNVQLVIGSLSDPTSTDELFILEGKLNGSSAQPADPDDYYQLPTQQTVGAAARNIGLVLPADDDKTWTIELPTSNVFISSADGMNTTSTINVLAADTKEVSGRDLTEPLGKELNNFKNASVTVACGLVRLNILEGSKGDVYCYWGGNEEPFTENLGLFSINQVSIRLTDYSVKYLGMVDVPQTSSIAVDRKVFTTGTTAIQNFHKIADPTDLSWAGIELTLDQSHSSDFVPNHAGIFAYWTGSALTETAIADGYDCGKVYTAAQLASVGEDATAKYIIPNEALYEMWLGGHKYPWMGAEVTVDDFVLDGDGTSLQNMKLDITDYLFNDPHHCCTSCGPVRKMNVKENLGLIRSIINSSTSSAEVKNVDLNDVYLRTRKRIDHIGSLVGYVETGDAIFTNNEIGEIKIDVNGDGIGGMVGFSDVATLTATGNATRGINKDAGYVRSQLDFVGGQFGYIEATGAVSIVNSEVLYAQDIVSERPMVETTIDMDPDNNTNVGGIAGEIISDATVSIASSSVEVWDKISAVCRKVGGIAGDITAVGEVDILGNTVKVTNDIESLESGSAGGAAGNIQTTDGNIIVDENTVEVRNIEANGDSFAAGLVAKMYSVNGTSNYETNNVTAERIYTVKQFAGGWIGHSSLAVTEAAAPADYNLFCGEGSVNVTKFIEAFDGKAGGLIGEIHDGKTRVGKDGTTTSGDPDLEGKEELSITVEALRTSHSGGGVIGENSVDAKVHTATGSSKYFKLSLDVKSYVNTIVAAALEIGGEAGFAYFDSYFGTNNAKHWLGTFGNLLGFMNSKFDVVDKNLSVNPTTDDGKKIGCLNVVTKLALGYAGHPNRQHTTPGEALYWGDTKYYVGWGNSGAYTVNGAGMTKGDQNDGKGYNLYKTLEEYKN